MGSCTRRHFLLSTCFLQMITIIERQVFDFLGYMWAPIFVNFFHIIFVIFGFYGAYHFRIKYIITYLIWNFIWIGWNAFLICFYLNVGTLDRNSDTLNLGTGSFSWFETNGYGCKAIYPDNVTTIDDPYRPIRPEHVDGCLLDYFIIEIIHSGVQCALAFFGILGAILISYIFLDEDDRFDFMNGDAKSPQHTVVHPMYVSYSSIPTSASATLLSNKHHQHQINNHYKTPEMLQRQQHKHHEQPQKLQQTHSHSPTSSQTFNHNNNTFLIHKNSKRSGYSDSLSINGSNRKIHKSNINQIQTTTATENSKQETLTRMQQYQRQLHLQQQQQEQQQQACYDDSTAKADQVYNRCHNNSNNWPQYAQQNHEATVTPSSSHDNTTSSLSYASLQNSNATIATATGNSVAAGSIGAGIASPFNHSNFSLTSNTINNNTNNNNNNTNSVKHNNNNSAVRFARIHSKPKPPKSSSYSSFRSNNSLNGAGANIGVCGGSDGVEVENTISISTGSGSNLFRPDTKYTQISNDHLSSNYEEAEDDNFSLTNFKSDGNFTYVPFQKPTPIGLFINSNNNNNNNSQLKSDTTTNIFQQISPNNNSNTKSSTAGYGILLERGAILEPALLDEPALNPMNLYPCTPSPAYRRRYLAQSQPTRPTNIPLPIIPSYKSYNNEINSPLDDQMPSPPPPPMSAPRPHIFQPRSGNAPYPDVSPEVAEKYAMPTQYIPRSPVASRIARRQRQQQQESSKLAVNSSANYCDQIRDTPPSTNVMGTDLLNQHIMRAKSHDRLSTASPLSIQQTTQCSTPAHSKNQSQANTELAPHVNRRSGRRADGKARPRSYCNSTNVRHVNKISKHRQSLYSIGYGPSMDTIRSRVDTILDYDENIHERGGADGAGGELSPKPMTPRRVKRRSVMARGANNRQSTGSRRSHHGSSSGGGTHPRSSTRSSRRKYQQNPVTKLLDLQQQQLQQHSSIAKQQFGSFHHKTGSALTETNLQTLNREINNVVSVSTVNISGKATNDMISNNNAGSLTKTNNNNYRSFRKNIPPDPIYYNMNAPVSELFQQQQLQQHANWQSQSPNISEEPSSPTAIGSGGGHFNPTYQHSITNLNDTTDEQYNNRPPSVRSSYSNFHGTRPLSFYNTSSNIENVFVGLVPDANSQQQQQQSQIQHIPPSTPPLYQQHPIQEHPPPPPPQHQLHHHHHATQQHLPPPPLPSPSYNVQPNPRSSPQDIPFAKRTASRESIRSMAFLNSGPPAYNLNYHTPPDSETTM